MKSKVLDYSNSRDPLVVRRYAAYKTRQAHRLRNRLRRVERESLHTLAANTAEYFTAQEVGTILKFDERTIRRMCNDGRLKHLRLGDNKRGEIRIHRDAITHFLNDRDTAREKAIAIIDRIRTRR